MGLPGSGKTTLAKELVPLLNAKWLNADKVRTEYNDWDFSIAGRAMQTERMRTLAEIDDISISAYVCPLPALRHNFNPDLILSI